MWTPSEYPIYTRILTGAAKDINLKMNRLKKKERRGNQNKKIKSPLSPSIYKNGDLQGKRPAHPRAKFRQLQRNIGGIPRQIKLGAYRLKIKPISQHLEVPCQYRSKNVEHSHYQTKNVHKSTCESPNVQLPSDHLELRNSPSKSYVI